MGYGTEKELMSSGAKEARFAGLMIMCAGGLVAFITLICYLSLGVGFHRHMRVALIVGAAISSAGSLLYSASYSFSLKVRKAVRMIERSEKMAIYHKVMAEYQTKYPQDKKGGLSDAP